MKLVLDELLANDVYVKLVKRGQDLEDVNYMQIGN